MSTDQTMPAAPPLKLAWALWGLGASLYLIGFFHRVAPGVLGDALSRDFGLGAAALGNLSAFYFYSYVAMQIPTGVLADHWGPRKLLTAGAVAAAIGSLSFALAPSLLLASLGRLLIGAAVAVAFVALLKFSSHWFSPRRYSTAAGMALFIGILGAVGAGVPLQLASDAFGWRSVMLAVAALTGLAALAIWIWLRDDPAERGYLSYLPAGHGESTQPGMLSGLRAVLGYRNVWILSLVPGGVVGSVTTFAGLWGVPFLTTHYGFSATEAAALASAVLVAWALGGPLFGGISDRSGRRRLPYLLACLVLTAGWALVTQVPGLPLWLLIGVLLLTGLCSGCIVIGFAFAKESVPLRYAGTTAGVCNMGVMMGPMLLQPLVGWMLDRNWHGELREGLRLYDFEAYSAGFGLMLAWALLSVLLIAMAREQRGDSGS